MSDMDRNDAELVPTSVWEAVDPMEWWMADESDPEDVVDMVDEMEESVELDDARSEWASVYLTVLISSSRGLRNETRFSAGNMGRDEAILRGTTDLAGLLDKMEARWCGCLYGTTLAAESCEADVSVEHSVEAESGVEALCEGARVLSMQRRGFEGRCRVGAVEGCSRALE